VLIGLDVQKGFTDLCFLSHREHSEISNLVHNLFIYSLYFEFFAMHFDEFHFPPASEKESVSDVSQITTRPPIGRILSSLLTLSPLAQISKYHITCLCNRVST
jgi:hypothetical protein